MSAQENSNRLLTPEAASKRLHVAVPTLNTWRSRGRGPRYAKIGGRVLYREADLDDFISKSVVDPQHTAA